MSKIYIVLLDAMYFELTISICLKIHKHETVYYTYKLYNVNRQRTFQIQSTWQIDLIEHHNRNKMIS